MKTTTLVTAGMMLISGLAHASKVGGIDGGGGGTLPANPVAPYKIIEVLNEAKRDLRMLIKYEMRSAEISSTELERKLYLGETTLLDVLESVDLEVLKDRACKDAFGNDVDGSIHASKPNTICVSAFSTAPKLIEERARTEILALLMHELSHMLGADEKEATELQRDVATRLTGTHAKDLTDKLVRTESVLSLLTRDLGSVAKLDSLPSISKSLTEIMNLTRQLHVEFFDHPFSILTPAEIDMNEFYEDKLMLAAWFSYGETSFSKKYEDLFEGKNTISYREFLAKNHNPKDNRFGDAKIYRIRSLEDLKAEIKSVELYYSDTLDEMVRALRHSQPLPQIRFPGDETGNPWENFLGKYEVISFECADPKQWPTTLSSGFWVHRDEKNPSELFLRHYFQNGWGDDGVYYGAYDNSPVRIYGGAGFAQKVSESGSFWGERWQKNSFTLSETATGPQMVIEGAWRSRFTGELQESSNKCVYQLKRIPE